jgi:hypothetical protein
VAESGEGFGLDLADPLAGEVEPHADLVEGLGFAVVEAEPQTDDEPLALAERREELVISCGSRACRAAAAGWTADGSATTSPSSSSPWALSGADRLIGSRPNAATSSTRASGQPRLAATSGMVGVRPSRVRMSSRVLL